MRLGRSISLRARGSGRPGLPQQRAQRASEDGGRLYGILGPAGRGRTEPFRSEIREHLKGRSEALEDLAVELLPRGLSVRDIEDAFRDESGRLLLSKTAVSEIGERLWANYQEFATRDRGEYEIAYLFVDGIAERIRPGTEARAGAGRLGLYGIWRQGPAAMAFLAAQPAKKGTHQQLGVEAIGLGAA
ncbi:transposase, partial [Mesorhizobium sp. M0254]|uniref:transposase n=1 Tax=Mesorhizobium sp. M0254 TaxID=2956927 RepID=UPI003336BF7D